MKKIEIIIGLVALLFITGTTFLIEHAQSKIDNFENQKIGTVITMNSAMGRSIGASVNALKQQINIGLNLVQDKQPYPDSAFGDDESRFLYKSWINGSLTDREYQQKMHTYWVNQANTYSDIGNQQLTKIQSLLKDEPICYKIFNCRQTKSFLSIIRIAAIVILFILYFIMLRKSGNHP